MSKLLDLFGLLLGGFFFWIIKGFRTPVKYELEDKYVTRNILTSKILSLLILLILSYPTIYKYHLRKKTKVQNLYDKAGNLTKIVDQYGDTSNAFSVKVVLKTDGSVNYFIKENGDTLDLKYSRVGIKEQKSNN